MSDDMALKAAREAGRGKGQATGTEVEMGRTMAPSVKVTFRSKYAASERF